jgi:hypothetical protein
MAADSCGSRLGPDLGVRIGPQRRSSDIVNMDFIASPKHA